MDDADRADKLINETISDSIAKVRESLNKANSIKWCIECGEDIGEARKVALPSAKMCIDCAD